MTEEKLVITNLLILLNIHFLNRSIDTTCLLFSEDTICKLDDFLKDFNANEGPYEIIRKIIRDVREALPKPPEDGELFNGGGTSRELFPKE